jgi:hypothetical protein
VWHFNSITIDTYFGNAPAHIEISAPHGAGATTFHVMINKYYNGFLMKAGDGWRVHLHPTTILQGDDIAIIIGLIEENLIE